MHNAYKSAKRLNTMEEDTKNNILVLLRVQPINKDNE